MVLVVKNSFDKAGDTRDLGSIPGLGKFPGGGHGNPLQCSGLGNPLSRETWWTTVHGVSKNWTLLKQLSMHARTYMNVCKCNDVLYIYIYSVYIYVYIYIYIKYIMMKYIPL